MKRLAILSLLVPALAFAQPAPPKAADDFYKEGTTQYNLGNFKQAAELFKKGFELETDDSRKTAYMFNVAQSYRQDKDCGKSVFFYKRYLTLKENDTKKPLTPEKRQEVEGWIAEGETCIQQQNQLSARKPDGTTKPDGDTTTTTDTKPITVATTTTTTSTDGGSVVKTAPEGDSAPHLISARLLVGASKLNMGDIDVPLRGTGTLIAGYPLGLNDKLILDLGAGISFTPVPFNKGTGAAAEKKSARLMALFANVAATYRVTPQIGIRGDLGVGALVFSGVSMSTFTDNNDTTGALAMFHLRVGVSADYAVTPNFIVTVAPIAFGYSPPKDGLAESIKSITSIDFMAGVGYRM